jgi:hypothetical protein
MKRRYVIGILALGLLPLSHFSRASTIVCPDLPDTTHRREIVATSAPEQKVRLHAPESSRWGEITRPLIRKAIKQAKAMRAKQITGQIDTVCDLPKQYVAQLIPAAGKASGCDSRIITRPADDEHLWVQAIATCRYDWACCTIEVPNYYVDVPIATGTITPLPPATTAGEGSLTPGAPKSRPH